MGRRTVLALEHLDLALELVHPPLLAVPGLGGGAAVARHTPCLTSLLVKGERQPFLIDQEVVDANRLGIVGPGRALAHQRHEQRVEVAKLRLILRVHLRNNDASERCGRHLMIERRRGARFGTAHFFGHGLEGLEFTSSSAASTFHEKKVAKGRRSTQTHVLFRETRP